MNANNESAAPAVVTMLTAKQVAERLNVSVRTVWRLTAAGHVPQPVRYNRKLVRWRVADLERASL